MGHSEICVHRYGVDKDIVTNVSPRIVRGSTGGDWNFGA